MLGSSSKADFAGRDGFAWWIGEVEDHMDPSQLGRVKVRIVGWYTGTKTDSEGKNQYLTELPTKDLPWATVLLPTDRPQTKNAGSTTELQPGAQVLGFFMDGEEAQLPCVLGAFRGFRHSENSNQAGSSGRERGAPKEMARTVFADPTVADQNATDTPQQKGQDNQDSLGGASFVKAQGQQGGGATGGEEASKGAISKGEAETPFNVYTNPIGPPSMEGGIADGTTGPANAGFTKDLKRMLTEIGVEVGGLARNASSGDFMSTITGRVIEGKNILNQLSNVTNFLTNAISGMLAPLKEMAARVIQMLIDKILQVLSNILPVVVITLIGEILQLIFALFCKPTPEWVSIMGNIMGYISSYLNSLFAKVMDFIAEMEAKILDTVERMMSGIQNSICKAMSAINKVANFIITAINTVKALKELANGIQSIFSIDFTKLDFKSVLKILKAILMLIAGMKDCGRKSRKPKATGWLPLLGTTQCEDIDDALSGPGGGDYSSCPPSGQANPKGTFFDDFFKNINPFLMETKMALNGTKEINDATPGKEKRVIQGPGGVSTFEDKRGNKHTNNPNNETAIIGRDQVTNVKNNKVVTVEGDYYLKVMGDYHIEVSGSINQHESNGPGAKATDANGGFASGQKWDDQKDLPDAAGDYQIYTSPDVTPEEYDKMTDDEKTQYYASKSASDAASAATAPLREETASETAKKFNELAAKNAAGDGKKNPTPKFNTEVGEREVKSVRTTAGDHDMNFQGDWKVQAARFNFTAIEAINLKAQEINLSAGGITNEATGEIINEANWISSFLNCGRFDIVGIFQMMPVLTGQFSIVKGSIVDVAMDTPFPGAAPPAQVRMTLGTSMPSAMADIIVGSNAGAHITLVGTPTGGIGEVVTGGAGAIINQVTTGVVAMSTGVGAAWFGCGLGPTSVFGLPVMLN